MRSPRLMKSREASVVERSRRTTSQGRGRTATRLASVLKIRPGEGRTAVRVLAMMFVVWSGFAIGGNAVEGLLFARFGPDALPYLFVGLGFATAAVMLTTN